MDAGDSSAPGSGTPLQEMASENPFSLSGLCSVSQSQSQGEQRVQRPSKNRHFDLVFWDEEEESDKEGGKDGEKNAPSNHLHQLVDFLMNDRNILGEEDVPTLLSPQPFVFATMASLQVRVMSRPLFILVFLFLCCWPSR